MNKPSCHGCAYEWADTCDRLRIHMPSDNPACQDCRRNPNRKVLATGDHYVTLEQALLEGVRKSYE